MCGIVGYMGTRQAYPKVESLWSDESLHYSHPLLRDSKSMEKDQLISMIHFHVKREDERAQENQELKDMVKKLNTLSGISGDCMTWKSSTG